jgi:CPA2 family monovalent cation:H+ antiporter-2
VGRAVADALWNLQLPCVLIEYDDRRVRQARAAGLPIIYGDAAHTTVLEAARIGRARAVLVTVPVFADVRNIVRAVRHIRPDLPIIARADGPGRWRLRPWDLEVTSPEFEAAIEMTSGIDHFNVPAHEILQVAARSAVRHAAARPCGSGLPSSQISDVVRQLTSRGSACRPTARSTGGPSASFIRTVIGVSVVGIIRAIVDGESR